MVTMFLGFRQNLAVLCLVFSATFLTLLPSKAEASTIVQRSIEEMSVLADAVARGEVMDTQSVWRDGSIVTRVSVRVEERWFGDLPDVVELWVPGGEIDGLRAHVAGMTEYNVGDDVIVFLQRGEGDTWRTLALSWSIYLCEGDLAYRSSQDMHGISPSSHPVVQAARAKVIAGDHRLPITQFRGRVKSAVSP